MNDVDFNTKPTKVNFIVESSELISSNILTTATYLTLFKDCKLVGKLLQGCYIELRGNNRIVFQNNFMEDASVNLPIYEANLIIFQNGQFMKSNLMVDTISVKEIKIRNIHIEECTKLAIVFVFQFSEDSSFKRSGGSLLVRSAQKVESMNVDFDGNAQSQAISGKISSPISFYIVDDLSMVNVTIQNHYSNDVKTGYTIHVR